LTSGWIGLSADTGALSLEGQSLEGDIWSDTQCQADDKLYLPVLLGWYALLLIRRGCDGKRLWWNVLTLLKAARIHLTVHCSV